MTKTSSSQRKAPAGHWQESLGKMTDFDIHLFNEGRHYDLHRKLGAHPASQGGKRGFRFTLWAPNAKSVHLIGDFSKWQTDLPICEMQPIKSSGIWEVFVPDMPEGARYKYRIHSHLGGYTVDKADPFAFRAEIPPRTASITQVSRHMWQDHTYLAERANNQKLTKPFSIYEMHLASWRHIREQTDDEAQWRPLTYLELAEQLPQYLVDLGFTHVEFLPVMEHPYGPSWGYQVTGYFAPTSRFGTPDDFKVLVDRLHQAGIGVILDWVPSHFPSDEHGLAFFDGTHLFEHQDPRQGFHPDWGSLIYNYGRREVRSILISNAIYWLEEFHIDGLRVDAVASMLYLDYSRQEGEWITNEFGGRENLQALAFLKELNEAVYERFPDVQTIAEESTAWPMVSRPTYLGGLGFGMKWDMGWMHDTLKYFQRDPLYRRYHQDDLTFRSIYVFNENFVLSLSHDEVVHGKASLLNKMPGDTWQKFANLRAMLAYMFTLPGKKLLFMGQEFGQWREWDASQSLDWHLLDTPLHQVLKQFVGDLNRLYRSEAALHETDFDARGFQWLDTSDHENCIVSYFRKTLDEAEQLLIVANLTPMPRTNYRLGTPLLSKWREILNSDAADYGGSGHGSMGGVLGTPTPAHGHPCSITLTIPPLSVTVFKANRHD